MIPPKLFISYARADDPSLVQEFWGLLKNYLDKPGRAWSKWSDQQVMVGEEWDSTISNALTEDCNCCLLLVSDLFANSSYIIDTEWPKTLARHRKEGILFFPVVFGTLSSIKNLPHELHSFQIYWPTIADLYIPPPHNVSNPSQCRQCYIDARESPAPKQRFASTLAKQMNDRYEEFLREQVQAKLRVEKAVRNETNVHIITHNCKEDDLARTLFGSFSYEKRFRDSSSRNQYFPRSVDAEIDERLQSRQWLLIEGHPLAGKTRAAFEAVKRLIRNGRSIALWPFQIPDKVEAPLIPPDLPDSEFRIVWMDDFDVRLRDLVKQNYSPNEISTFLERAASLDLILLATARTGPAYHDLLFSFGLNDHLWDKLEPILIPRLSGEEAEEFGVWYRERFGESLPDKFDHHPGSLFLDLKAMDARWKNMENIAIEHKADVHTERAKDILRALHVFYVMNAYKPGGYFLEEDVRLYLRQRQKYKQTHSSLAVALGKALPYNDPFGGENWENLIQFLSQDRYHLGFIRREQQFLLTETAYLDYIIATEGDKNIARIVDEIFSQEDRTRLGLSLSSWNFADVYLVKPLRSSKELKKLARTLGPLGLRQDVNVWNQIVEACPSYDLARVAVDLLREQGITPTASTYHVLLRKAKDSHSAEAVISGMRSDDVGLTYWTYCIWISRVDVKTARILLERMKDEGIAANETTYNALLARTVGFDSGREILKEMRINGIAPTEWSYRIVAGKIKGVDNATELLDEVREYGIVPSCSFYERIMARTGDLSFALDLVKSMEGKGIPPTAYTFRVLIGKAQGSTDAWGLLEKMKEKGVARDAQVYRALIGKAADSAAARALVDEMKADGISPDVEVYRALIGKAADSTAARAHVDEMKADGIPRSAALYTALIGKAADSAAARAIVDEMKADGIEPTSSTFGALIRSAEDYQRARMLFDEIAGMGSQANVFLYNRLLEKANDETDAQATINEMRELGIAPNATTERILSALASDD